MTLLFNEMVPKTLLNEELSLFTDWSDDWTKRECLPILENQKKAMRRDQSLVNEVIASENATIFFSGPMDITIMSFFRLRERFKHHRRIMITDASKRTDAMCASSGNAGHVTEAISRCREDGLMQS